MKEKDIQVIFNKKNKIYGAFELKLCKSTSVRFDAVADHQLAALLSISSDVGFTYKIPDPPVFNGMNSRFNIKRPFDCFKLRKIPSYIVICFYEPRVRKTLYYITPMNWMLANQRTDKKSINEKECNYIADEVAEL